MPTSSSRSSSPWPPVTEDQLIDEEMDADDETPLLSGGSSTASRNGSSSSRSSSVRLRRGSNGKARRLAVSDDEPNVKISPLRAVGVGFSIWLLIFLQTSNMSGMTMVQGSVAEDLNSHENAMWFTTSFMISMSCTGSVAGRIATIFSPRSLVIPVSLLVAAGSLITSIANSFTVFIAGRVITGIGGGGVITLAIISVLELTSKKRRGFFFGLVNSGLTLGVSFGAVVYGALVSVIGWRPLFWVQAPLALLAGLGYYLSVPPFVSQKSDQGSVWTKLAGIDYLGTVLLSFAIVACLYGLAGDIEAWPLVLSLGTIVLFIIYEYMIAKDPIIPLKVLSSRGVLFTCFAQLGLMLARWSILFYSPIFMLAVVGAAPATAGSVLIPTNLGFGAGGLLVGWLHIRRTGSFWLSPLICVCGFSLSLYVLALLAKPGTSVAAFVFVLFVNGMVTGAGLNYTLAHLLHLSHKDTEYVTTSLLGTFRGFGGSFGTSIGGGIFYRLLRKGLTEGYLALDGDKMLSPERSRLVSRLLGTPELVYEGNLAPEVKMVAMQSYASAINGVWIAGAVIGIAVIFIQAATGWTAPQPVETDLDLAHAQVEEREGLAEA